MVRSCSLSLSSSSFRRRADKPAEYHLGNLSATMQARLHAINNSTLSATVRTSLQTIKMPTRSAQMEDAVSTAADGFPDYEPYDKFKRNWVVPGDDADAEAPQ